MAEKLKTVEGDAVLEEKKSKKKKKKRKAVESARGLMRLGQIWLSERGSDYRCVLCGSEQMGLEHHD